MPRKSRLDFDNVLRGIIGSNVYFQEPESFKMKYPCIKYELTDIDIKYADNLGYRFTNGYLVTLIDKDPDSSYFDLILALPMTRFQRSFKADGLNHFVFYIYY